jgi:hypothetical protein
MKLSALALYVYAALVGGTSIEHTDTFCRDSCASLDQCSRTFGEDYAALTVSIDSLPLGNVLGESLVVDQWLGGAIARQTFETQFILDLATALDTSPCRIYISDITDLTSRYATLSFLLYPADFAAVQELSMQARSMDSKLLQKRVTSAINQSRGIHALKWDYSVKLMISLEVVGGSQLNADGTIKIPPHGNIGICNDQSHIFVAYCDFEHVFRSDLAMALSIEPTSITVLFVKPYSIDSVVVHFRLNSGNTGLDDIAWTKQRIDDLSMQLKNFSAPVFSGNVTLRLDVSYGISGHHTVYKTGSPFLPYALFDHTDMDDYERCQISGRCPNAWASFNQSEASSLYSDQTFMGGEFNDADLFADFEDWQKGTYDIVPGRPRTHLSTTEVPGAHWSPFDFDSLGPSVPTFNGTFNKGLVFNNTQLKREIKQQESLIVQICNDIQWLKNESEVATLDATKRFRRDVTPHIMATRDDQIALLDKEVNILRALNTSQCVQIESCHLTFNTSSLELSGAVNASGYLVRNADGSEVALWSFDSINIDYNVSVRVVGQRALALLSRSSIYIDTPIEAAPGTLGGFPGGYSVSRRPQHQLFPVCLTEQRKQCDGDAPLSAMTNSSISNNVNGPGSASARFYLAT